MVYFSRMFPTQQKSTTIAQLSSKENPFPVLKTTNPKRVENSLKSRQLIQISAIPCGVWSQVSIHVTWSYGLTPLKRDHQHYHICLQDQHHKTLKLLLFNSAMSLCSSTRTKKIVTSFKIHLPWTSFTISVRSLVRALSLPSSPLPAYPVSLASDGWVFPTSHVSLN